MFDETILVGNLGKDPQMRFTPKGAQFTTFSIATNHRYTDAEGNPVETTSWWIVTAWGKLGETCNQYLKKGRKILVRGRMISDRQTGGPRLYKRKDGSPGASHELKAEYIRFLDKYEGNGVSEASDETAENGGGAPVPPAMEEEIPF
jgi:single-strand DNA-binding protein